MSHSSERYHSLDSLRAFAMFLGIMLHGMISFTYVRVPFWPAHDVEQSLGADLFIILVHDFRMQTFFLLAGFFGCLLYQRFHLLGMLKRRFVRIVIPFAVGLVVIVPTLQFLWLCGDLGALRYAGIKIDPGQTRFEMIAELFVTGSFVTNNRPFHLWFLYYLIIFFALMLVIAPVGKAIGSSRLGERFDRWFRSVASLPGKAFLLAALTTPLLWPSQIAGMVDTQESWQFRPHILGYYFFFFVWGWTLWRHRDLLHAFTGRWKVSLLVSNLLVAPVFVGLVKMSAEHSQPNAEPLGIGFRIATLYVTALYTWLMVGSLMGLFQHFFHRERRWVRYLADASYWCYLWHLTPIVGLQILLQDVPLFGPIKFILIIGASMILLLATYEWCVRYTLIGAILNGRKHRQPAAQTNISGALVIGQESRS